MPSASSPAARGGGVGPGGRGGGWRWPVRPPGAPAPRRVPAVAVATGSPKPASPCGACRQVMVEFGVETVYLAGPRGPHREWRFRDLLPDAFPAAALR